MYVNLHGILLRGSRQTSWTWEVRCLKIYVVITRVRPILKSRYSSIFSMSKAIRFTIFRLLPRHSDVEEKPPKLESERQGKLMAAWVAGHIRDILLQIVHPFWVQNLDLHKKIFIACFNKLTNTYIGIFEKKFFLRDILI